MEEYAAEQLIKKILNRDFDRWIRYITETKIKRESYKQSFCVWKEENGFIEEDAKLIAELFN